MFTKPNTITELTSILDTLKCNFADLVYLDYIQQEYSLKKCTDYSKLDKLSIYIDLIHNKINNINILYKKTDFDFPSIFTETDMNTLLDCEKYLSECNNQLIYKAKMQL